MSIPIPTRQTITNLFPNPSNESFEDVVVWENTWWNPDLNNSDDIYLIGLTLTPADEEGWAYLETDTDSTTYLGTNQASRLNDITENDEWFFTFEIKAIDAPISIRTRHWERDPGDTENLTNSWLNDRTVISPGDGEVRVRLPFSTVAGVVYARVLTYIYEPNSSNHTPGNKFAIRGIQLSKEGAPYFGGSFSPDSDLSVEVRPGGGSQLVGRKVAGVGGSTRGVTVQSRQWGKSDSGFSARYIANRDVNGFAQIGSLEDANSAVLWRYQEDVFSPTGQSWAQRVGFRNTNNPEDGGMEFPNVPEERLGRFVRGSTVGTTLTISGHNLEVGQSVWFDLLTATDTPDYDGPPFSGDTEPFMYKGQMVYPKWDGTPGDSTSSFAYYESSGPWTPSLTWDKAIQRAYHLGVSKGVLEIDGVTIPWSGLTEVIPSLGEGEVIRRYLDGVVYDVRVPPTDYKAQLSAFTYPLEFEELIGAQVIDDSAVRIHGQEHKPFNFCYRTEVGNAGDIQHYRLHFVYGAYAVPTAANFRTISASPEGATFDFDILTTAQFVEGYRPSAYYTVDTREANAVLVEAVEKVLYGTNGMEPHFPPLEDLIYTFE